MFDRCPNIDMNHENPFQSPLERSIPDVEVDSKRFLLSVARRQRAVLFATIIYLVGGTAIVLFDPRMLPQPRILFTTLMVAEGISVGLLTKKLFGVQRALLYGVLSMFPLWGLLVVAVAAYSATKTL